MLEETPVICFIDSDFESNTDFHFLKELGNILNLSDYTTQTNLQDFHFIICNINNTNQVEKLKSINMSGYLKLAFSYNKISDDDDEEWIQNLDTDAILYF
jgi:hypothetical protein